MTEIERHDVVVIGAGPAGLAAALGAKRAGVRDVIVLERDEVPGGVLNQCIHDGFGLFLFKQSLSGPEFAENLIEDAVSEGIRIETSAMVLDITGNLEVRVNTAAGYRILRAGAVILAMGCRERTREMLEIPGTRPAGIFTAGSAQNLVNLRNLRIGNDALILGSGDIGLIMARRLTLEGMNVLGVHEVMPYCGGLERNVRHCLVDFGIPLTLSSTVVDIEGHRRLEAVVTADADSERKPVLGTEKRIRCDTLLLSVGLIPENELSRRAGVALSPATGGAEVDERLMTSVPGIFACGNVLHIHDIADMASGEGFSAGRNAAEFIARGGGVPETLESNAGDGIRYCVPSRIRQGAARVELSLRVDRPGRNQTIRVVGEETGTVLLERNYPSVKPSEELRITLKEPIRENVRVSLYG